MHFGATMLTLSKTLFNEISTHAEAEYPHECCGGLIGTIDGDNKIVTQVVPIENNWEDTGDETKTRRFMITSDDYRQLERKASDENAQLLGFYHSHPDHPPEPSETDLKFAWPFFSYPILSVHKGVRDCMKSYELDLESNRLVEEGLSIS